jgi:hypothetical protein
LIFWEREKEETKLNLYALLLLSCMKLYALACSSKQVQPNCLAEFSLIFQGLRQIRLLLKVITRALHIVNQSLIV